MEPSLKGKKQPDPNTFFWVARGLFLALWEVRELARERGEPVKVFDDEGRLVGTVYPDGVVEV